MWNGTSLQLSPLQLFPLERQHWHHNMLDINVFEMSQKGWKDELKIRAERFQRKEEHYSKEELISKIQ